MNLHFVTLPTFFVLGAILTEAGWGQSSIDFARDIQPILSNKCYPCHGPDENTREGGIRFDLKAAAFAEADSGEHAIVAGDLDSSEMIRRIFLTDSDQMPPATEEKQLTLKEKQLLKTWVSEGAPWKNHWAFETPVQPKLPPVKNQKWIQNEIDHFILARLEAAGRAPSPRASKTTLIRRVTFDLTGLPPSPEEIAAFVDDSSPNAFEKVVDRLLKSEHYGEQMASVWLDAARFADTNGYQNDFKRNMWPWRDWVIRAYNENKPFDQFVIEQLAGDMLPNPTRDQIIATGFNRNHRMNTEGGSIEQEWLVENVVDRVETTSTVFLGLTMGCARCHDHKYDPISQKEFYQFFAYFYNVDEKGFHSERRGNSPPMVKVKSKSHDAELAKFDARLAELKRKAEKIKSSLTAKKSEWEADFGKQPLRKEKNDPVLGLLHSDLDNRPAKTAKAFKDSVSKRKIANGPFGKELVISGGDQSYVSLSESFDFKESESFTVSCWVKPTRFGAILSRMDASDAYRGFDMLLMANGQLNVHLIHRWPNNAIKLTTRDALPLGKWSHVAVTYDGSSKSKGFKVFFNSKPTGFQVNVDALQGTTITKHPLWLGYRGHTPPFAGSLSDTRIYKERLSPRELLPIFENSVIRLLKVAKPERNQQQLAAIDDLFRAHFASEFATVEKEIANLKKQKSAFEKNIPTTMVMKERKTPRECYVLNRGQYDLPDKKQQVFPATPSFFPAASREYPANRLGLAKWLVDKKHPLTSRVAVNRYWQRIFGVGILETAENFGVQSPQPSHPKLLDWLATEFVRMGWDVKALQKKIVMSATYQQDSAATPKNFQQDPANRMLARGPRFRLSAEQIRDNALAVSGLLSNHVGGPSIKPYQPAGVWKELAGGAGEGPYVQDRDDRLYRRSLYIYRKRTVPHPTMTTFDAGSREICQVSRSRTNTPLQALALLNDRTYVEAARCLGQLAILHHETKKERLRYMFRRTTGRFPSARESQILESRIDKYLERFQRDPESAKKWISNGQSSPDPKIDASELASYSVLASILLNLDETLTKE